MAVRINANSCKNALGTVFLLATAFFVCSTFISMRSVLADPIAPQNTGVVSTGRQSPRSSSRTSKRTISRSTVSRGTTGATVAPSRSTASRSTVSRGTAGSKSVSSRSITPTRQNANVVSRGISSRGQATRTSANNRAVRARTATNVTRVAANGNVIAGGERATKTAYSYLNSTLYSGNYANIVDSTTGLISADAYANCMDSYYACMDEICTARSTAKGRCSCAGRANNFLVAEEQLEKANEELITLSGQLSLLIATKGKGDEIASAFTLTEAEQVMNCVSWQETISKYGKSAAESIDWCSEHGIYSSNGGAVTSCEKPDYCDTNNYGFKLADLTNTNITGSSSDILAQLKAWADAKDLAAQYQANSDDNVLARYNYSYSAVMRALGGSFDNQSGIDSDGTTLDTLAKKWGYKLFEYAHNNVCGRVLDSCFNGIYEACGTPPSVTDSDGNTHKKCMNGATTACPFNYNSYIHVETDATAVASSTADGYGEVVLNERSAGSTTDKSSASCFGYSSTASRNVVGNITHSTSDPYVNLRGPIADARRSIMQKYLLDANSACDAYGESLKNTAQNINYQKVAAQQALQQKRLEFKQQEDSETESNYTTYASNFVSCLDEIWDCYIDTADSETWTTARIKTYCAQKSNVPHCYEPMVCSPSRLALSAVIDKPDDTQCTFAQDFRKNTCRNVVTISEILYGANSQKNKYSGYTSLTYSDTVKINSAELRESCLQEAGVDDVRSWGKVAEDTYVCTIAEVSRKDPNAFAGYKKTEDEVDKCTYITECKSGYVWVSSNTDGSEGECKLISPSPVDCKDKFGENSGVAEAEQQVNTGTDPYTLMPCKIVSCEDNYTINDERTACIADTRDTCDEFPAYAASGHQVWNGSNWGVCIIEDCLAGYKKTNDNRCVEQTINCDPMPAYAVAGTQSWNTTAQNYDDCVVTQCDEHHDVNSAGDACEPKTEVCDPAETAILDGYALTAKRTWSDTNHTYGPCKVTECKAHASVNSVGKCACDSGYSWNGTACGTSLEP